MKFLKTLSVVMLCMFSVALSAQSKLTPASVHGLLDSIQESVVQKNADAFAAYFTPDAQIAIDYPAELGGPVTLNLREYKEMLEMGWAMPMTYTYEVFNIKVAVDNDGQSAIATDVTVESMEMGSFRMDTETDETMKVVLHNGRPKISKLSGVLRIK